MELSGSNPFEQKVMRRDRADLFIRKIRKQLAIQVEGGIKERFDKLMVGQAIFHDLTEILHELPGWRDEDTDLTFEGIKLVLNAALPDYSAVYVPKMEKA